MKRIITQYLKVGNLNTCQPKTLIIKAFCFLHPLHRKGDALALQIDISHTHHHMVVELHHLVGVAYVSVCQLGDMHQTVIVDTYIDKGAEIGDVGHDARHHHAHLQVANLLDGSVELKLLYLATRVETRLVKLRHNISQGWHTNLGGDIFLNVYLLLQGLVLHKLLYRHPLILCHLLHEGITLGMDGSTIQWILGIRDAEETSTLLVSRRT